MPSSPTCPNEAELLALAAGEEPAPGLGAHLAECPWCRERLEQLNAEVAVLRRRPLDALLDASTAGAPASDPATTDIPPPSSDATTPLPVADTVDHHGLESETDLGFSGEPGATGEANLPAAIGRYLVIGRFPRCNGSA
jgi:hypothetical protein